MWISALRGHTSAVRRLLLHPDIDIDRKDFAGVTALWAACQDGHHEIVELLLNPMKICKEIKQGADPNLAKNDGCTPLWVAASQGNTKCIQVLIKYGADVNKPDKTQGATPLFSACQNGKKAAADLLLSSNADIDKPRTGDGTTSLMMAAHNGHKEIVDLLLKNGADTMMTNKGGLSVLGCAAMGGYHETVKLIHQFLSNIKNEQEILDFANAADRGNGWTALHLACMNGHENVIKYLINNVKVDIWKKDLQNMTAMEHAWQNGHQTVVSYLSKFKDKSE